MKEHELEEKLKTLDHLTSACTGCGLCLEGCATYRQSGWEHESPRGRIHLAEQFMNGRIAPASQSLSTFDRCLSCHACEPLCPQNVSYGRIRRTVQELRGQLNRTMKPAMERSIYRSWIKLARRLGSSLWRRYAPQWLRIPNHSLPKSKSFSKKMPRPQADEEVLAFCCLQDLYQPQVIKQTLDFMERIGRPLKMDMRQPCCGAIFERLINGGEESIVYIKEKEKAISLQNKTTKAFLKWLSPDAYFLAKGCHAHIRDRIPGAQDIYQLIDKVLEEKKLTLSFTTPREVYYQPYCRPDGQMKDPILRLLQQIKGLRIRYVADHHSCCGGYCGEVFLHPDHAKELSETKIRSIPPGSTVIVTSPDCWGIFTVAGYKVMYPIQLLEDARLIG